MKAYRGSHKQEFQKLWRWRCSKAWPHLPNEVLRQAKVCLPVVTRPWPFLKHYMVYVKIRFKLRNLSVSSSSPPFVFSQTYSYSHDVHLSCHIKIIAKCAGEEEEQLLQVIFWKTPYMIVQSLDAVLRKIQTVPDERYVWPHGDGVMICFSSTPTPSQKLHLFLERILGKSRVSRMDTVVHLNMVHTWGFRCSILLYGNRSK